ncbi:MAG: hypothetical protein KGZ86_02995 [Candidatus Latescibacteria bacterium]|nr:hypothetical protein [Candidatus Latescibacterota bacterium]
MNNERSKILAAIGYIPFLCFIPIFAARDDEYSQFHGKQSLVLLIAYIIVSIALWLISIVFGNIFGHVPIIGFMFKFIGWISHNLIGTILGIVYVIMIIISIIYAAIGNKWEIPVISNYAKTLKI